MVDLTYREYMGIYALYDIGFIPQDADSSPLPGYLFTLSGGDPKLNLHLPLLGGGWTQDIYVGHTRWAPTSFKRGSNP